MRRCRQAAGIDADVLQADLRGAGGAAEVAALGRDRAGAGAPLLRRDVVDVDDVRGARRRRREVGLAGGRVAIPRGVAGRRPAPRSRPASRSRCAEARTARPGAARRAPARRGRTAPPAACARGRPAGGRCSRPSRPRASRRPATTARRRRGRRRSPPRPHGCAAGSVACRAGSRSGATRCRRSRPPPPGSSRCTRPPACRPRGAAPPRYVRIPSGRCISPRGAPSS